MSLSQLYGLMVVHERQNQRGLAKHHGHPREVGSLVVYLAPDATDFVTGQLL